MRQPGTGGRGFTLLELLVVLVILALTSAVAIPSVMKLVHSMSAKNQVDHAKLVLQDLPVSAMKLGRPLTLHSTKGYVAAEDYLAELKTQGVRLRAVDSLQSVRVWIPADVTYLPNGACTGGVTHWELAGGEEVSLSLSSPFCSPRKSS